MRIAVMADIHANDIALKGALHDAQQSGVEHLLVLGDVIGYYYWPDRVLEMLDRFASVDFVCGNHEYMLRSVLADYNEIESIIAKYGSGIRKAIEKLTPDQQSHLTNQPFERRLSIDGCDFLLCHGSPLNNDEYVYPDAHHSLLQRCAVPDFDFVFMGHTHYPMCFHHGNTTVVNPGSVGQPRDFGDLAAYVIIDTQNRSVVFRRVQFNPEPIIKECEKHDPKYRYLSEVLMRNSCVRSYGEPF